MRAPHDQSQCGLTPSMKELTYEHTHILKGLGSGWVAHSPLGLALVGKLRQRVMGVARAPSSPLPLPQRL